MVGGRDLESLEVDVFYGLFFFVEVEEFGEVFETSVEDAGLFGDGGLPVGED